MFGGEVEAKNETQEFILLYFFCNKINYLLLFMLIK